MAYFANGTEGDLYEAQHCKWCVHSRSVQAESGMWMCPVMWLHALWNYEQQGDDTKGQALDALIPRKNRENCECLMFVTEVPQG